MTTREQNDFLTSDRARHADGRPVSPLLDPGAARSEDLPSRIARRCASSFCPSGCWRSATPQGRVGLIDEFCAHRGVSLWFGRNEESGLRCPYHGWKYDVTGQCIEVPSEPAECGFCSKIKLKSYPCVELGDVIWAYMGPPELQAAAARISNGRMVPAASSLRLQAHAGMQLAAGDGRRHRFRARVVPAPPRPAQRSAACRARAPSSPARPTSRFEVIETDGGMVIGVRRPATQGQHLLAHHAVDHAVPHMIPPYGDNALNGHAWVPIDDENCMSWCFTHHPTRPLTEHELHIDAQRRRHPCQPDPRHVPSGGQQGQRLHDRSRRAEGATRPIAA